MEKKRGQLFIIAGPSAGVGKNALAKRLLEEVPELSRVVTATTRPIRGHEKDGDDYYFLAEGDFNERVARGEFIEWVWYAGYQYGTLREPIMRGGRDGKSHLMVIEFRGAQVFRKEFPSLISIFILPPSFETLRERMMARNENTREKIEEKLEIAKEEMKHQNEFDYIVVNDDLETAVSELVAIVKKYL